MKPIQAVLASAVVVAVGALSRADPAPTIHYAPAENLEHVDVELIDSAQHEIDFAAYVLTDWPVVQALTRFAAVCERASHQSSKASASSGPSAATSAWWLNERTSRRREVSMEPSAAKHADGICSAQSAGSLQNPTNKFAAR
jgi:hypothetical protein